eukprot:jgi/Botrbrau1/22432/Bobra.0091s0034.1
MPTVGPPWAAHGAHGADTTPARRDRGRIRSWPLKGLKAESQHGRRMALVVTSGRTATQSSINNSYMLLKRKIRLKHFIQCQLLSESSRRRRVRPARDRHIRCQLPPRSLGIFFLKLLAFMIIRGLSTRTVGCKPSITLEATVHLPQGRCEGKWSSKRRRGGMQRAVLTCALPRESAATVA